MALLFLPFISMHNPRAHKLAVVSENEEERVNQWEEDEPREEWSPNFTQNHTHSAIHILSQTKSIQMYQ